MFRKTKLLFLLLTLISLASCDKEKAQCKNGLNVYQYDNCQCPVGSYRVSGLYIGDSYHCYQMKAQDWVFQTNDSCFSYGKLIFQMPNLESFIQVVAEGPHSEYEYTGSCLLQVIDGEQYKGLIGDLLLDVTANDSTIIIDFRSMKESYSFCKNTNEGFFITGKWENGQPTDVRLNHGQPGIKDNYNVVSSTPILVSK